MKKFIGITQRLLEESHYREKRETLALDWGRFFSLDIDFLRNENKKFLPLPLSYEIEFEEYLPFICGVILSGGNDLSVLSENNLNLQRDRYERNVIQKSIENNIPILGVCHGAQALAHFFGAEFISHQGHIEPHLIHCFDDNFPGIFKVNSYHCYCIKSLDSTLIPLAFDDFGNIEAFVHQEFKISAMMWHIEREQKLSDISLYFFKKFIDQIHLKEVNNEK